LSGNAQLPGRLGDIATGSIKGGFHRSFFHGRLVLGKVPGQILLWGRKLILIRDRIGPLP
jgi:hypothetical protein